MPRKISRRVVWPPLLSDLMDPAYRFFTLRAARSTMPATVTDDWAETPPAQTLSAAKVRTFLIMKKSPLLNG
jgi:hypothetical protein